MPAPCQQPDAGDTVSHIKSIDGRAAMRPEILFPLFAPVTSLKGVGSQIAKRIEELAGPRLLDLCWHLPAGLIDRRYAPPIAEVPDGATVTLRVHVDSHKPPPPRNRRVPYRVSCSDDSGKITLVFFHARPDYLNEILPVGEERIVSGRAEHYDDQLQMTHPDHVVPVEELEQLQRIEPVYPLTAGLTPKPLLKAIRGALAEAAELPEWLDPAYQKKQAWPAWRAALKEAHEPQSEADLAPLSPARQRLAYDELLANQLALALVRAQMRRLPGRAVAGNGALGALILKALPYQLTGAQEQAVAEIKADMAGRSRMLRLLQGDVGSGKTVVALLAMIAAVEAGSQAALMAPTEILARQHFNTLAPLAKAAKVSLVVLTGRDKGKARDAVLKDIAGGKAQLVIGTHALFQDDVAFADLAFAVIDEQHRFGVHQRLMLTAKGQSAVDVLVMTATPIPRTLTLTAYGDMEVSRLTEKPPGRSPIETSVLPLNRLDQVVERLKKAVAGGGRAYWVCPLVEESETSDLAAASARHESLLHVFGDRVGLVHGRMKAVEKDAVMAAFAGGDLDVLVATTVIEVGVDVQEATIMVIEHAERFGLAQLHQLRGRVGRGGQHSSCLLLYAPPLTVNARSRLNILRDTEDGFRIAEEDLRLRGAGELLGVRQSGLPTFRVADLAEHGELLAAARDDARLIIERDADLTSDRGEALRVLLYLFERDAAIKYLRSG